MKIKQTLRATLIAAFSLLSFNALAQSTLRGTVVDNMTNEPIPGAVVRVDGRQATGTTDFEGKFRIDNLAPGLVNVRVESFGYEAYTAFEVQLTRAKPAELQVRLKESAQQLQEVEITAQSQFQRVDQSPVSVQSIGINEIRRNPGANQDISKVIQSLPGVASGGAAFRNDLVIRGGGPNENIFFLDGIEIPAINHFATQGASGGPVGMINVNFIRDVDFYTSAFPVQRGGSLSSVMELNLRDGSEEKVNGIFQVGASEVGLTLDGPLSKKTTYLASVRRSYLQYLFSVIGLPFLPTYNDYQIKVKHKFDRKNQITFLSLGAYDVSELNLERNETEDQRYILNYLPSYNQWNYSIGAKYTHFGRFGATNVVLSRFMLDNQSKKYFNNDVNGDLLLNYGSQEIANKLRVEQPWKAKNWEGLVGFGAEQLKYNTNTFDKRFPGGFVLDYETAAVYYRGSLFANAVGKFLDGRMKLSLGLRTDVGNFNENTQNPLDQLSPRAAVSYNVTENWTIDANVGRYFQLPPFTALGYKGADGDNSSLRYIQADHYVLGSTRFLPWNAKASVEGFYKDYQYYPLLLRDSISLATLGGDFGVIGNQLATPTSTGRAYGAEFTYQQKLFKGWFGIAAVTLVRSEFADINGTFVPSSWDNRMIATFTFGKKFGKNWEFGGQYQHLGGAPYTPFDIERTRLIQNWNVFGRGLPDYSQLNSERYGEFDRLNLRIDKKWFLKKWNLDLYFDVQNALGYSLAGPAFIDVERDANGTPVVDSNDPTKYSYKLLENRLGIVQPGLGIIVDF